MFAVFAFPPAKPTTRSAPATSDASSALDRPTATFINPARGPREAPVTVVTFGDYQCLACSDQEKTLTDLSEKYGDRLRVVWKDLPNTALHPQSLDAALAARCAGEQDMFWPYHDQLFARQSELTQSGIYERVAQQLNLDGTTFETCLKDQRTKPLISKDIEEAIALGLDATPFTFIGTQRFSGATDGELLSTFIEFELAEKPR